MEDRDSQELVRRRIEEEILKNLETRLFRYYRNVGSIIVAAFGIFGISLWTALPDYVSGIVTAEIRSRVVEPIAQAKLEAEKVTKDVGQTLEAIRAQSEEVHIWLGRLSLKSDEIRSEYGKSQAQLEDVRSQTQNIITLTKDSSNASKYFATQDDIARIATSVAALAEQTAAIATTIRELQVATGNSGSVDVSQQEKLTELKTEVEQSTPPKGPDAPGTVFVQFAGGSREDIRQVSGGLRNLGWSVPGEERVGSAAGLSEVRYFYSEDRPKADDLARDLTGALRNLHLFTKPVIVRDASANPNIKLPRRGVFEVWIEIPVR